MRGRDLSALIVKMLTGKDASSSCADLVVVDDKLDGSEDAISDLKVKLEDIKDQIIQSYNFTVRHVQTLYCQL